MKRLHKNNGFTLMELIVTIGTFVLLTTSLVGNMRQSSKSVVLNTLANRIVTEIRGAQTYSLAKPLNASGTFSPYGVSFVASSPKSFVSFVDINSNGLYDGGAELVNTLKLQNGNTITKLCVNMKEANTTCTATTGTASPTGRIDITFRRPYPEPVFKPVGVSSPYSDMDITISSDNGTKKTIVVWITGQISIE